MSKEEYIVNVRNATASYDQLRKQLDFDYKKDCEFITIIKELTVNECIDNYLKLSAIIQVDSTFNIKDKLYKIIKLSVNDSGHISYHFKKVKKDGVNTIGLESCIAYPLMQFYINNKA